MESIRRLAGRLAARRPHPAILVAVALALMLVGSRLLPAHPALAAPGLALQLSPRLVTDSDAEPGLEEAAGDVDADVPAEEEGGRPISRVTGSSRGGTRSLEPAPPPEPKESLGDRIAAIAREYVGYRYTWGGHSPSTGFDCSGFTSFTYQQAGVEIPTHDLRGQLNAGPRVALDNLLPGDIVFFENTYTWGLSHNGVYVGDGKFINANSPGVGVVADSLNERYWRTRFVGGSRPWRVSGERRAVSSE